MKTPILTIIALSVFIIFATSACATRKYARNRVNERVAPLEQRTGELEETSRRNTQDIAGLTNSVKDVSGRVDRAQAQADTALARADAANNRAGVVEQSMTDLRENLDKFTLQNSATVNFKVDSAELNPEAQLALDQLAGQIKDRNNFILEIQGFADAQGSESYNHQLTQKRAESVRRYLAEHHNISLHRMHVLGFGKVRPVADNTTVEGRAMNRRVEIHLLSRTINNNAPSTTSKAQGSKS
ncbi:MAG: OmpA family protein [Acidobacteriota bacterium]